jgi:hypothetical protein
MRGLEALAGPGGEALVRVMREAQRLEKEVRLVQCGEETAGQLRAMGLRGDFWHYPSLLAATEGAVEEPGHGVTVYLRRDRATRARLRLLVASLAPPCGLDEDDQAKLVVALDDVCGLAGPPHGADEERLTLIFFACAGLLTVDVSWRAAPALHRDVARIWERRPSTRPRQLAALDGVETLAQADSVVIRLKKQTRGAVATSSLVPEVARPTGFGEKLPDMVAKRSVRLPVAPQAAQGGGRFGWTRWISRPRLALVAGFAGRSVGRSKPAAGGSQDGQDK